MYQFEDKSTVCFFGDSITSNGWWLRRIYSYYRNVLGKKFELYNCGVPGNTATEALGRMEETLFPFEPTDVVIMFGMNDVGATYGLQKLSDSHILGRRRMLDNCLASIKDIAFKLAEKEIRMIFCTPTPYDELTESDEPVRCGVAAALTEISGRVYELADKFDGHVVDFNSEMYAAMKKHYKEDFSIINTDRVHPELCGHELMTQLFLNAQGFDIDVTDEKDALLLMTEKPFDEWENKRFELEQAAKANDFVKWALCPTIKSSDAIRSRVKSYPEKYANEYMKDRFDYYLNNNDKTEENVKRLIEFTKTIYV